MDANQDTAAQRAERAWHESPELRAYFQRDKQAFIDQAVAAARIWPVSADQPALNAIHSVVEMRA